MPDPRSWISISAFTASDPGGWRRLLELAQAADRAGVDGVALASDHLVFGEHLEDYRRPELGGSASGAQPTDPDGICLEPLTTLSALSALTSNVRLTTLILLAALRRPVLLAKTLATLDVLSAGRLEIGVGVGWQKEEYGAVGLDFEKRGELLDQTLEVCQLLWCEQRASYSGPGLQFDGIHMMPKPVNPGGVPVWVSGTVNGRAMRRLARFGSGWIPWGDGWYDRTKLVGSVAKMRDAVSSHGRDPSELRVACRMPVVDDDGRDLGVDEAMEEVVALLAGGVTDFHVVVPPSLHEHAAEEELVRWSEAFKGLRTP